MKVFKSICIDKETRMEMVASECSYNEACCYLSKLHLGKKEMYAVVIDARYKVLLVNGHCYVYDEHEGFLMRTTKEKLRQWKNDRKLGKRKNH